MNIYLARCVLPVEDPPIESGAVAVEAGRIVAVGKAQDLLQANSIPSTGSDQRSRNPQVHDLGDCLLLPGFVNAHAHLELSCYQGRLSPKPLWDWFEDLMPLIYGPDGPKPSPGVVAAAAAQSLAAGVTCVGDISRTGVHLAGLRDSPIRKVCFLELISQAMMPPNDARSLAAMLDRATAEFAGDRLLVGVSPHTLYTVTWDDLQATAELAASRKAVLTVHVAETQDEVRWLAGRGGLLADKLRAWRLPCAACAYNSDAFELLDRAGVLALSPLLAHVNYIDDASLDRLASSSASVAWCPRSHRFFGHASHRWREMLDRGINVCLGTDSLASNDSLSVLDEIRFVRRQSRVRADATALLEMATLRGAAALGQSDRIGSLRPGKRADFVTVPRDRGGPDDPVENLLDGNTEISGVWIDGSQVFPS